MTHTEYELALYRGTKLLRAVIKAAPKTTAEKDAQAAYAAWYDETKPNAKMRAAVLKSAGCAEAQYL